MGASFEGGLRSVVSLLAAPAGTADISTSSFLGLELEEDRFLRKEGPVLAQCVSVCVRNNKKLHVHSS